MTVGGKREGAGRKLGAINRISMRAREEAARTGELPHEFLLRIARGDRIGDHEPAFHERMDAAKAAAPYFAPRLAATNIEAVIGKDNRPAQELSEEELMAIITEGCDGPRSLTREQLRVIAESG